MLSCGRFFLRCVRVYSREQACISRFSLYAISMLCFSGERTRAEPEKRRSLVMRDTFADLVAVALSAGYRQTGNSNRVAAKGVSIILALEEQSREVGRSCVSREIRELIRQMSTANPLWGAPRIHGELLKLGVQISQATVAKYIVRRRRPPSQTWRTFLENHVKELVSTIS
ncbi:hypothetical protein BH20ACI3_BH20ACI3_32970 [soil metagenome]